MKQLLDKWLSFTLSDLHESLAKNGIGVTGELDRSITGRVQVGDADAAKIMISYVYYGKLRDMGVRRGVPLAQALGGRQKGWYTSVMNRRMMALTEIMVNKYGHMAAARIKDALPGTITLTM